MTLANLVEFHVKKFAPWHQEELDFYTNMPTLHAAVKSATLALRPDETMHPHQCRVGKVRAQAALKRLLPRLGEIEACESFNELHSLILEATKPVERFGVLAVYDTSLRIAAYLDILPDVVYLHCGAKAGAKALGLPTQRGTLAMDELPKPLRKLAPHEVEDFLCTFKDCFNGGVPTGCLPVPRRWRKGGC